MKALMSMWYGLPCGKALVPLEYIFFSFPTLGAAARDQKEKELHSPERGVVGSSPGDNTQLSDRLCDLRDKGSLSLVSGVGPHVVRRYSFGPSPALQPGISYRGPKPNSHKW